VKAELLVKGSRFQVKVPYSPILVSRFGAIGGSCFLRDEKAWSFPLVRDCLLLVSDVLGILPQQLPDEAREVIEESMLPVSQVKPNMSLVEGHTFLTTPYEHQKRNLALLLANNRWLLADEMGTGKTSAICNRLVAQTRTILPYQRVLIVCPKSVMAGWQDELWKHSHLHSLLVEGSKQQRADLIACPPPGAVVPKSEVRPYIINYEGVLASFEDLSLEKWAVVVFDEVHRVKGYTNQTSRACRYFSDRAIYVWGLSGTPAPNGLEDWHGVLQAIDPTVLNCPTKKEFESLYVLRGHLGNATEGPRVIVGYRNTADLHRRIMRLTSRVTKAEALDLPEKVYLSRSGKLAGEQARVYRELKKDAVARIRSLKSEGILTVRNVLTESLRLLQVVGGFVPDDQGQVHELPDKIKVDLLDDFLDDLGERQVVIWCAFRSEVHWLSSYLFGQGKGRGAVASLTGESSTEERKEAIEAFAAGKARYFVATAAAGGTGVNGLQVADTEIFYSRNWSLTDYLQAQDRCHRHGQKRSVSVVSLVAQNSVDEKVHAALEAKQDMMNQMLSNPEEYL
jgi:SNF2 family DNA or RNA helicase